MDTSIEFLTYKLLNNYTKEKIFDFSVFPLFGDASGREYFRIKYNDDTAVLMKVADIKPGEFGRGDSFLDFISIRNLFDKSGISVPEILSAIPEQKCLLLEDLGDTTLFKVIESDKKNKVKHIKFAINTLSKMQKLLYERTVFDSPADKRSFDSKLLMDEFFHFFEYMIEKRIYDKSFKGVWTKLEKNFKKIVHELTNMPYFLSHRDFQSKNIMIKNKQGYLIDFQDALMAPAVYDIVSLLRDSYIVLTDEELDILLKYYWDNNNIIKEVFSEYFYFERAFYIQTVQRKMKDAGRFIYLNQVKNKEWFLPYVVPTLNYVKKALLKLEMEKILEITGNYIPELKIGQKN